MLPTIVEIVRRELCLGCGICELSCPYEAISMAYDSVHGSHHPIINSERCTNCGLCQKVCFAAHHKIQLNRGNYNYKALLGKHISCYIGYATDQHLRFKAASGGIVTALLTFLLENDYVDGAVVTKMEPGNPPLAKAFIAKNKHELNVATGSKYCPVILTDAFKAFEQGKRYAIVGLPCQIYAAKKLAEINNKFKKNVKFYIGLFCGGVFSYNATVYLLQKYGLKTKNITRLEYRGGGWPGRMLIQSGSSSIVVPFLEYYPILAPWFYMNTCMTCTEGLCSQADVSCGDAWIPAIMNKDRIGTSIVVSRTGIGDKLLKEAEIKRYIKLQKVNTKTILDAQKSMLAFKHLRINERLHVLKILHKYSEGSVGCTHVKAKASTFLEEFSILLGRSLASRKNIWPLFDIYRVSLKTLFNFLTRLKYFKSRLSYF
ncbi:MAG: Coenzyme F420 hydrogenase/dehydrogenase, beta subunit C-terminal domain [Nitrososphaeria archaeon]